MDTISEDEMIFFKDTYASFNRRDIDATLKNMDKQVDWPNGMEGGIEHGHEAIRNYWTRQWKLINPLVDPVGFTREQDGRINVTVHQVIFDMEGKPLVDQLINHIYTIKNGLITSMEIKSPA